MIKAMEFNWTTKYWELVEVTEQELAQAREVTGSDEESNLRQLVSLEEYEIIQQAENHFKIAADPALVGLMDALPGKLEMIDSPDETCH
jgi:hypothetical protein